MRAVAALGVLLIAAGLLLFISTVERSPWVLGAAALVALGCWLVASVIAATEGTP